MSRKDITGEEFGYLTAIEYDHFDGKYSYWKFACKCGKVITRRLDKIYRAKTPSCGCYQKEIIENANKKKSERLMAKKYAHLNAISNRNLVGEKIGKLTVDKLISDEPGRKALYLCKCECGKNIVKSQRYLANKSNKHSCGCDRKSKHMVCGDKDKERLLGIYEGMVRRCYNKNIPAYKNYGGRGIKICNSWLGENGFNNFYEWSIRNGYSSELSIDRINVYGNYSMHNCRWADVETQSNNKRNSVKVYYNGEVMSINKFSKCVGISTGKITETIRKEKVYAGQYIIEKYKK